MGLPREDRLGRYELLLELGRGGMAELWLGRLLGAGGFAKLVAIKRILPQLAHDAQFKQMFLDEGRIAAQLSHPNVCQVFELAEEDGELYLAMEYLDGVSWEQLIGAAPRPHALRLTAGMIEQAAAGLHYAHALRDVTGRPTPVVHRDVSPQNLFVTVDGVCKVLDFGVSKMMTDGPRTRTGVIKGKLPYMAPEQIRGEPIDGRADVFSLGVCAWEALAGARLFERDTDYQIWKAVTEHDAPAIATRWPGCPPAVDAAVRRALEREAGRRTASALAFADELCAAVQPAAPDELAHAVRTLCGDRIAERAYQVATAIGSRTDAIDPGASDTIEDAGETASMQMRRASVAVQRRPGGGGAELRGGGDDGDGGDAGETRDLRSDAGGYGGRAPAVAPRPASHARTALLAATAAAAITAVVVLVATRRADQPAQRAPGREEAVEAREEAVAPAPAVIAVTTGDKRVSLKLPGIGFEVSREDEPDEDPAPAPGSATDARSSTDSPGPAGATRSSEPRGAAPTGGERERGAGVPPGGSRRPRSSAPAAGADRARAGDESPASAQRGLYSVDSKPYATIYVDGELLGDTPLFRAPLAAGARRIRAVLQDGRERTFTVDIEPGKPVSSGTLSW